MRNFDGPEPLQFVIPAMLIVGRVIRILLCHASYYCMNIPAMLKILLRKVQTMNAVDAGTLIRHATSGMLRQNPVQTTDPGCFMYGE